MTDKRHIPAESPKVELLRADRDLTREELAGTLAELTHRIDVPARARERLQDTADTTREKVTGLRTVAQDNAVRVVQVARLRPVQVITLVALLAALVGWLVLRDRRN
ncbi:DUF3618 domain-containing protein [Nocardia sp. NPDC051321]|uniref:DUF3618 domain-containing protein n=1 Tax=Nocardia sp. NPDC051321 TaxID=3364323 RepID=UPI0037B98B60